MRKKISYLFIIVLLLSLPLHAQKLSIAVADFENKSDYPHSVAPIRDMIVNELFKTGRFGIFEREKLGVLMKEKQLAQSGLIKGNYSEKFNGVDAIVYGSVTGFGKISDTKGGLGGSFKWGLVGGRKKETVEVRIHLRIISVNTGEILGSSEAVGRRYLKKGIGLGMFSGVPVLWGSSGFDNTMIGRATTMAVGNAVRIIQDATRSLYRAVRSDGKIHNRFREKYPSIFDSSQKKLDRPVKYSIKSTKRDHKVFVLMEEWNLSNRKYNSVVGKRLVSALKKAGYPVVAEKDNANLFIDGMARSYYVATLFDRLYDAEDYKSANAKVELRIINLTNGEIVDTFSYTLPKPRLHLRTELAGAKALQEISNIVANRIPSILQRSDIDIVQKKASDAIRKKASKPVSRVKLILENVTDFESLSELKQWLVKQKFYPTITKADFTSGKIIISVKNTSTFELAEVLNGYGYKIATISEKNLTARK